MLHGAPDTVLTPLQCTVHAELGPVTNGALRRDFLWLLRTWPKRGPRRNPALNRAASDSHLGSRVSTSASATGGSRGPPELQCPHVQEEDGGDDDDNTESNINSPCSHSSHHLPDVVPHRAHVSLINTQNKPMRCLLVSTALSPGSSALRPSERHLLQTLSCVGQGSEPQKPRWKAAPRRQSRGCGCGVTTHVNAQSPWPAWGSLTEEGSLLFGASTFLPAPGATR